jgi:hypothetical protein
MFGIESLQVRTPEWFIKNHLEIFFGKNEISDNDLFWMMIRETEDFSHVIHAVRLEGYFLIATPASWIIKNFRTYENYFLTLSVGKLKNVDSTGANTGALLYALCERVFVFEQGDLKFTKDDANADRVSIPAYLLDHTCLIFSASSGRADK